MKIVDLPSMLREAMTKKEAKASVTIARMESAILALTLGHALSRENIRYEASLAQLDELVLKLGEYIILYKFILS